MGHFLLVSYLLLWSFTRVSSRPLGLLLEEVHKEEINGGEEMAMIGSRPPICEGMCTSCGRCEAVQVPLFPSEEEEKEKEKERRRNSTSVTSIADDTSNYKPMKWKCKCGGIILNP